MNQTVKLLQTIVENGRMGEDACDQLLSHTKDEQMRNELMQEKQDYAAAAQDAENLLFEQGVHPQPKGPMARMGLWMGMQINTAIDQTSSHIADLVIQGANMGVIAITKARNTYTDADAEAQGIASNLITKQQEAIERLKTFLREQVPAK